MLEKGCVTRLHRKAVLIVAAAGYLISFASTAGLGLWKAVFFDYFLQPVEIQVLAMSLGFITMFYSIPENWLSRHVTFIECLANCSLGVYILHPLVGTFFHLSSIYQVMKGYNLLTDGFTI